MTPSVPCTNPDLSNEMATKIGSEYKSERATPRDFEKLADEAGLSKPILRGRVLELAEGVLAAMGDTATANPVAEAVSALVRRRCEATLNRFRK